MRFTLWQSHLKIEICQLAQKSWKHWISIAYLIAHLTELRKISNLTCGVFLFLFHHIVVIHIIFLVPLVCLSRAVLHRDHSEVGGHFYTMCFLSMSPVRHALISFSLLLPLCSAALLSLSIPLSNSCRSSFSLSCSVICRLTALLRFPGQTSGLTSEFLLLSLGFCCTPMWPWPPPHPQPRTNYPNKEQHKCPAQWGQCVQRHTLSENMTCICAHEWVTVYIKLFLSLRADPLPRNAVLYHTWQKTGMSAFVQREEEIQYCSTEKVYTHTNTHIYISSLSMQCYLILRA